ncbi:FAD-binding and (Fe-S)-binding domain-containing protein [Lacihabitans soyangensis]|uniref:D-lactate dehydrogenase (cytochrome) n=1 Tax=Lacihabitans soyangensis TaxID=869394 RepID=A0AAE3KS01_9BACT|nr:FAD-binding and (Fe-S)-binding domain-containing protein [Lacihabitans soyangensis]MCP9762757.1 FAD-binding oxidoreductase [Lacihabitans soyangensis]
MSLGTDLRLILTPEKVKDKYIDLVSYASDAGFYYLVPKAVVQPSSESEIVNLLEYSQSKNIPVVFRGGGTSLSGQSITDGILVDLGKFWNKVSVENDSDTVRVQPGITGAMVNAHLRKFQRKIGPDPSSINAAMMGGILSNNASGMCCGVAQNSYHTVKFIKFILPDGKIYSTEQKDDYVRFEKESETLFKEIEALKSQIVTNESLQTKIREKYKTKNTVGYALNAFLDYEHPLDIFAHLLIGGEGTLAFIAEAVMHTVSDLPYKSTGLLYFEDIFSACQAIEPLIESGAAMVELMDRASLRSVQDLEGMPAIVKTLPTDAAALLVEFQEQSPEKIYKMVFGFSEKLSTFKLLETPDFTKDPKQQAFYWKVRKGLFPAVGAVRASGTTVILEDVAFPVAHLGNAIVDIQALFQKFGYHNGIIFGHAKDGNIHFVVTQAFDSPEEINRYDLFIRDVVDLVVHKYKGSLKAEHGTGRNMAPFVATEWGDEAYEIMKRLKKAVDPQNLLNPGVIINDKADAHIHHLKKMPKVEDEVDRCIECGFCEPNCPSKNYTSSPRRRIVTRRVLENLKAENRIQEYNLLVNQFQFDGLDTCAVDGLCAVNCPVDINTGDLVKKLRVNNHSKLEEKLALFAAKNFDFVVDTVKLGLIVGHGMNRLFGKNTLKSITGALHKLNTSVPIWSEKIPKVPEFTLLNYRTSLNGRTVVYFPSCITRMMGTYAHKEKNLIETFYSVCDKSNINLRVLKDIQNACCGQIFSSKGYSNAFKLTANKVLEKMWLSSEEGKLPVVIDVSSCQYTLKSILPVLTPENKAKFHKLKIMDSIDFIHEFVLPNIPARKKKGEIVLHPVCSLQKLKTHDKFVEIAQTYADKVIVPLNAGCCGMAGDRGFLVPELTASATFEEAKEVKQCSAEGYYSSTKTCEMAMSEAVGANYESILYLVDEAI